MSAPVSRWRENASLGLAGLMLAMAAGCTSDEPAIPAPVQDKLHTQPVGSYTLLPVMEKKHEALLPTGRFNLVVKINEVKNEKALNPEGQPGTLQCSSMHAIPARLNEMGQLTVRYSSSARHCWHYSSQVIDTAATSLNLPTMVAGPSCYGDGMQHLEYKRVDTCSFTPH